MDENDSSGRFDDRTRAQDLARQYRCEFMDLYNFRVPLGVLKRVPMHLMFRYNFVPIEETATGRIAAAFADPSQLMSIDEISMLLGKRIVVRVATLAQISETLARLAKAHGEDCSDRG